MIIQTELVRASMERWTRTTRVHPHALSQQLGDGDRSGRTSASQRQTRYKALMSEAQDPVVARVLLERMIAGNDLSGINYLEIGTLRARSVCRLRLRDAQAGTLGFATGFLVAPGVLMTNHHVISSGDQARFALAEFDYEYDVDGIDKPVVTFRLLADPPPLANLALDFCLVALAPRSIDGKHAITDYAWLHLNPSPQKAIVGEYLTIIQHPSGERKQVCVRENKLLKYDEGDTTLWYATDTAAGSSGSPVFNTTWDVVALHHSGVPATDKQGRWLTTDDKVWTDSVDEAAVKWIANEGIRISSVVRCLTDEHADHPLSQRLARAGAPALASARTHDGPTRPAAQVVGEELRLTIPVQVAIRMDTEGLPSLSLGGSPRQPANDAAPALADTSPTRLLTTGPVEAVVVDRSSYAERTGYDPKFLGQGALRIPLPKLANVALRKHVLRFGSGKHKEYELRYWNYSVIMNKRRRLAFVSAINVDGELRKGRRDPGGDRWYFDSRIDEAFQLGPEFYAEQRELEFDRSQNPFDRGHLSARNDAQWGKTECEAKRNGDDSFHWTNCSPQHYRFNEGRKLWEGLEQYVIDGFARASDRRASVFNGPVFDAPRSKLRKDGTPVPNPRGRPCPDPKFGKVAIPKLFFKIVACARDRSLSVAAFLMSQEDLLATVERVRGLAGPPEERLTQAEAKLFQVSVAEIEALTGLDFGPLRAADTVGEELLVVHEPRELKRLGQIAL